ncbi:MAG: beta-ketoacyl synthase N-terminal-like domain-containing protein [Cyanobacteria bacterium J06606_4]
MVHSWSTLPDLCNEAAPRSSSTLDEAPVPSGVQAVDETQGSRRWQQLIQDWLIESISKHLKIEADQLKLREPLADYGLSSLVAVRLSGELQDWLELPLDPTLLYDYPSIEALSKELAKRKQNTASKNTADKRSSSDDLPEIELPSHPQRRDANDDIAVIGMGCRFPGAATLDDYWKLLLDGEDAVQSVPPSRWDVDAYYDARSGIEGKMTTRYGGFIENVDRFDAQFFKISPREAASMDPQQRLLLEVAWETLEQAGIAPSTLKGSQTGVFVGMSSNDYSRLKLKQQLPPTAYFGTSHALSIVSNRLSYVMDWRGPSVTVDTACSSSLVAIHQACQSLKMKDCDLAIAGGVNIILDPDLTVVFSQAQMMAADGRCKTFDATADGYVRAEGCGMVLLKPLSAARRDGDTIFGVIKGSAVNQDGRSNGLTAPNAQSQQAVITQALKAARIYPDRVSYIEAHGTGTALGDPIEVNALKAVFEPRRSLQNPLYIGSVKTNIGHLESAAGIAGFIKVILSLHHRTIVPTLHCKQINPLIDIANTPIEIAQSKQLWQKQSTPRYHGISSFGFGGTNAHLVVSEAPAVSPSSLPTLSAQKLPSQKSSSQKSLKRDADRLPAQPLTDTLEKTASFEKPLKKKKRPYHLITLSAATPEALQAQVEQYRKFVLEHPEVTLGDLCFSVNTTRERLAWRISLIVQSRDDLLEQLASQNIQQRYKPAAAAANRCAFLFAKQGNPWQVGYQLYATQPQFRAQLDRCDEILQPIWQRSLVSLLYTDVDGQSLLQDAYYGRPALLAVQYAIASLWMSWGVVPSAVAGDSFSELIAACAAGATDLQAVLQQAAQKERPPQAISTPDQQNARLDQKTQAGAAYDLTQLEATGCDVCIEITPSSLRPPFVQKKLLFVPAINKASEDWKTLFRGLVALDRLGTPLSWHKIDGPYGNRLSNLPTYPFQRRRYWFDNSNHTSSVTASTASQESTSSDVVTPGTATAVDSSQIHLAPQLSTFSNGSSLSPSAPETTSPDAAPPTTHLTAQLEVDSSAATSAEAMNDIEQVISSQLSVLETLMTQQLAVLEGGAGDISLPTSPLVENGPFEDKPLKNKPTIDEPLVHELK